MSKTDELMDKMQECSESEIRDAIFQVLGIERDESFILLTGSGHTRNITPMHCISIIAEGCSDLFGCSPLEIAAALIPLVFNN